MKILAKLDIDNLPLICILRMKYNNQLLHCSAYLSHKFVINPIKTALAAEHNFSETSYRYIFRTSYLLPFSFCSLLDILYPEKYDFE